MNSNFGIELNDDAAQMVAGGSYGGYYGYYRPSMHVADASADAKAYGYNTFAKVDTYTKTTPYSSEASSKSTSSTSSHYYYK
jgi:hypothetical protein